MSDNQNSLEADFQFFESHRAEWSRAEEGKYAVVHDEEVIGFFDDYGSGLRAGLAKFGPKVEFLVQQVCVEEPVFVIY
ncbi:MAG: hypothetical protein WBM11_11820 [Terriglobales bacterium]